MLQDPRSLLQRAEERRRSGRLKEAISVCLEGLSRNPNLDAVRVTLGRAYLESGQSMEARDTLQEVFSRLPDHHLAGKLLAEARKRLGDLDGAAATCREILRHYPRDREVEALLASVEPRPAGAAVPAPPSSRQPGAQEGNSDPSPDYLPEDVASAGPVSNRPPRDPVPEARPTGDALQTNTLADLYLKQGLVNRALEVYRGMLRLEPGHEPLRRRIQDLESRGAAAALPQGSAVAPAPVPQGTRAVGASERPSGGEPMPARDAIARLGRWLDAIRSGSDAAGRAEAPR